MADKFAAIGRLAFRVEGKWWVAYYAMPDIMEKAAKLATIRLTCTERPERKQEFMDLMREVVADILEETTGHRPDWKEPTPAPESERSGSA